MRYVFYLCCFSFLFSCSKSEQESKTAEDIGNTSAGNASINVPAQPDEYYKNLLRLQLQVIKNPDSREAKEAFIHNAYFPDGNALITVGSARTVHPESGAPISRSLVKRAALLDAKRWAVYSLLWLNNDFQPDFGKISENFDGVFKEMYSFNSGDSLIIAIALNVRQIK